MATSKVLHERVATNHHRRRAVCSQTAHRPQTGFEPAVVAKHQLTLMSHAPHSV